MTQVATLDVTHWIPHDEPKVGRLTRRALCGALAEHHSNLPTCPDCLDVLARRERENAESRFG